MMNKFKIGDICVIQNVIFEPHMKYNGEEVTITGLPGSDGAFADSYRIKGNIPHDIVASPEKYLRLKRDGGVRGDMDKVISWDECSWRPKELVA